MITSTIADSMKSRIITNLLDAASQRRVACFILLLLFFALETFVHVQDEQQSGILNQDNVVLHSTVPNKFETYDKFGFYLMGDTPYADWEETMLQHQIQELNQMSYNDILFTVHVGDIQKVQRSNCAESHYQRIAGILEAGRLPTFVIPGDNDWFDCPAREISLDHFTKHLVGLDQKWQHTLRVMRNSDHPELFAFEERGILFLAIHLINAKVTDESPTLWSERMARNQDWVTKQLDYYFSTTFIRGVVVLGHSLRSPRTRPFFESLATNFLHDPQRLKVPVVYLHGDGHNWDVDHKFSHQLDWPHYYHVQIDQGALADPCIVEFAKQKEGKMIPLRQEHDQQLLLGGGLVRIDRQRGRYSDEYVKQFSAME